MGYTKVRGFMDDMSEDLKNGFQEYNIVQVDFEDLRQDPLNAQIYDPVGEQQLADLVNSIKDIGLQQPLVVKKDEGRSYTILSGHSRYAAISKIKEEDPSKFLKVPCYVRYETISPAMEKVFIVTQNIQRMKTPADINREIQALKSAYEEMTESGELPPVNAKTYVASLMNISESSVYRYERIEENLSEELKDRFYSGEIGINTADKLAGLSETKQHEVAQRLEDEERITPSLVEEALTLKKDKPQSISVSFTLNELKALIGPGKITKKGLKEIIITALSSIKNTDEI